MSDYSSLNNNNYSFSDFLPNSSNKCDSLSASSSCYSFENNLILNINSSPSEYHKNPDSEDFYKKSSNSYYLNSSFDDTLEKSNNLLIVNDASNNLSLLESFYFFSNKLLDYFLSKSNSSNSSQKIIDILDMNFKESFDNPKYTQSGINFQIKSNNSVINLKKNNNEPLKNKKMKNTDIMGNYDIKNIIPKPSLLIPMSNKELINFKEIGFETPKQLNNRVSKQSIIALKQLRNIHT